jgi:sugar/nucleoside kinase (ribokinase family)
MSNLSILGIGNALVDILVLTQDDQIINDLNLPKGGMTLVDRELSSAIHQKISYLNSKTSTGGSVANAINGIAGLGVSSGYIGSVGKDFLGSLFKEDMLNIGIKTFLKQAELPTGCAIGIISPDGERTFATYLGAAVDLQTGDLKPEYFKGFELFLIEGYLIFNQPLIMSAASMAKSAGLRTALDLASFNVVEANIDPLNELVDHYIDILFANEEEAKAFTGLNPEEALRSIASRCDIAIVKVGKCGAFIQQGNHKIHVPAITNKVIDTTGAGDYFAAGFLAGYAKGYDLEKCGKLGTLLASRVIGTIGAQLTDNDWEEIKRAELLL